MSNTFEILARGRCVFNGDWYEGDVKHHRNGDVSICPRENNVTGVGYYVEAETLTPYIQRIDKNGKKVFLGDIVRLKGVYADSGEEYDVLFLVGYDSEECMFSINGRYSQFLPSKEQFIEECEVVGNQWDNPELMSEVEK